MRRLIAACATLLLALAPCAALPTVRSINVAEAEFFPDGQMPAVSLEEAILVGLGGTFTPCAYAGATLWPDGVNEYKPGLGVAIDFKRGLYSDLWYYVKLSSSEGAWLDPEHIVSASINLERGGLYAALRETVGLAAAETGVSASFLTVASCGWTFAEGSSVIGNASLMLESGAVPSPSFWGEGAWRALDWLSVALGGTASYDEDGFAWTLAAGPSFYVGRARIDARCEPHFGVEAGRLAVRAIADIKF